jgi:photosystem II stability/assembly factor-like uncharacterized protein
LTKNFTCIKDNCKFRCINFKIKPDNTNPFNMKALLRYNRLLILVAGLLIGSSFQVQSQITDDPDNQYLCAGGTGNVQFAIKTDLGIYTFRWQLYDSRTKTWLDLADQTLGVLISGSGTKTLTFTFSPAYPITTAYNGMQVRCKVSSKAGTVYSRTATTTVRTPAAITSQPVAATKIVGESVTFSVTASGTSPSYQWQKNSVDISGATSSSYTIPAVATTDAGSYRCVVSVTNCNTVYSNAVSLTVWPVLAITKQPVSKSGCVGATGVSFSLTAAGNGLTYQWQSRFKTLSWVNITGATGASYTLPALITDMNVYTYRCIVTGNGGLTVTSNVVDVTVYSPPSVGGSATNTVKNVGESVTFGVSASGSLLQYEWRKNGSPISGATSSTYTISSLALGDAGTYTCRVWNTCNSTGVVGPNNVLSVETPAPDGWFLQTSSTSNPITKVSNPSIDIAFGIATNSGTPGQLVKTTNRGINWTNVSTNSTYAMNLYAIDFLDHNTGFVGTYDRVMKTTDGGSTWSVYVVKTGLGLANSPYVYDIQMLSSTVGWAVGSGGLIMKTEDGGATWIKKNYGADVIPAVDGNLNAVFFLNSTTGFVAGASGVIVRTTDGGANWTKLTTGTTGSIKDIEFGSSLVGIAVTASTTPNHSVITTDGGNTWTALNTGVSNFYPNAVDFIVDQNRGYLGGRYYNGSAWVGTVLKTDNGGTTWYRQSVQGTSEINHLEMVDANNGFAVGLAGEIHRTSKGGCNTPIVDLGIDKVACQGTTVTLVANSSPNNINSKYLWSPGNQTGGTLGVTTSNTYGVTVTNECGTTATDNVLVTFNPLPEVSAGPDVSICNGETTQLLATGANSYSWNNATYLDNALVANPIVTTAATRTFTVTGTDANGCQASDAVVVTVKPIPSSAFTAPTYVCNTSTGSITYTGGSTGTFSWEFDGGTIQSGTGSGPYVIKWDEIGDKTVSLSIDKDGCISSPTTKIVNVRQTPTSDFEVPAAVCGSNGTAFFYTGNAPEGASYTWGLDGGSILSGSGRGPLQVAWATGGNKNVSLSVTDNGCTSTTTNDVVLVSYPYEGSQICMVTVDPETERNMVVWERTPNAGIASYNVYRESLTTGGVYELLGNVPYSHLSLYIDTASRPKTRQYLYKIAAVDTCGNESAKSKYHKTILLQYANSTGGININWFKYQIEGENADLQFLTYRLFKGFADSTALNTTTDISSSVNAYIDVDPNALINKAYYRIAAVKSSACAPSGNLKAGSGPYIYILSNLEDNKVKTTTGVSNELTLRVNLSVYPNPYTEVAYVNYNLPSADMVSIEVYNLLGERVWHAEKAYKEAGQHRAELRAEDMNNQSGLYYVKLNVGNLSTVKKVMLMK